MPPPIPPAIGAIKSAALFESEKLTSVRNICTIAASDWQSIYHTDNKNSKETDSFIAKKVKDVKKPNTFSKQHSKTTKYSTT